MAKYKCKVYEIKNIPYGSDSADIYDIPLEKYLSKSGVCVVGPCGCDYCQKEDGEIHAFHLSGATILLQEEPEVLDKTYTIRISLVSKASKNKLDDIVNRIRKKFPDFKKTKEYII